jgi:hypothetical protein
MMIGLAGLRGLGGFNTCDMVVDGNGNGVDCSSWSNIFSLACWNPLSPCAADGCVDGQPCTVDCSKSQLGTIGCNLAEAGGAAGGWSVTPIQNGAAVIIGGIIFWKMT